MYSDVCKEGMPLDLPLPPINTSDWDHEFRREPFDVPFARLDHQLQNKPPVKQIVLEREAGQLLTDEQVLQQLKEKEERALKAKRVTTRTLKRPTAKTKQKKILTTIHDMFESE
ncbi:unnamed protein product [Didymodactylos carnosus]|uniref:Uncharacterized protein n=1 Tax=Didymodactylos carnosus TaxID=1234261 RepID=A0A8S2R5T7_9BILA|nr:unnamed protein product [Didymodactylos carnosus]CAF4149915.1 unnamed protein product [Didymodactylos carnosus]